MIDYEQQRDTHSNMFKNAQRSKAKPNQKKIHVPTPKKKKKKNVFKKIGKNSNHCAAAVAAAETTTKPNFYNNM